MLSTDDHMCPTTGITAARFAQTKPSQILKPFLNLSSCQKGYDLVADYMSSPSFTFRLKEINQEVNFCIL